VAPDVPVIVSEYVPAEMLAPLMVSVVVAGNEVTDVGVKLQLPWPYVLGQLRVTALLKPSCEAMEIVPVPLLPALISGNGIGSVSTKSGFDVTVNVNDVV